MVKGFTQKVGLEFEDTFSHAVRLVSIRLILAIVAQRDLKLFQMDVKVTFVYGELDEEIHMDQPEGF